MDDRLIAKQVKRGNTEAFRLLVVRYERPIFSFLQSFGFNSEDINDIAQEVFLRGFKSIASFDDSKASFATWIFTIAKNYALNQKKNYAYIHELNDQVLIENYQIENQEAENVQADSKHHLSQALARIPERFRNAIAFSFLKELSIKDIAKIEDVAEGTVKSRVHRGKIMLRELLSVKAGEQV